MRWFCGSIAFASFALLATVAARPQISPSNSAVTSTAAVTLSPEFRGDLAMAHQQYAAAIDAYRQAPQNSAVIANKLGTAYHHLFAVDQARIYYLRALHLRPNYPEALNNLGAVYYAKKEYRKAEKYYRKAIRLDPTSAATFSNLGTAEFADRKYRLGIEAYRSAFALNPRVFEGSALQVVNESLPSRDRAQQDYCVARLFAQSGDNSKALEYLRKALNEGYDDAKKLLGDQALASLRTTPQFAMLMTEERLQ